MTDKRIDPKNLRGFELSVFYAGHEKGIAQERERILKIIKDWFSEHYTQAHILQLIKEIKEGK